MESRLLVIIAITFSLLSQSDTSSCPDSLLCQCDSPCEIRIPFDFSARPSSENEILRRNFLCKFQGSYASVLSNYTENAFDVEFSPKCETDRNIFDMLSCTFRYASLDENLSSVRFCGDEKRYDTGTTVMHIPNVENLRHTVFNFEKIVFDVRVFPFNSKPKEYNFAIEWTTTETATETAECPVEWLGHSHEWNSTRRGNSIIDENDMTMRCFFLDFYHDTILRYRIVAKRNSLTLLRGNWSEFQPSKLVIPRNVVTKAVKTGNASVSLKWSANRQLDDYLIPHSFVVKLDSSCDTRNVTANPPTHQTTFGDLLPGLDYVMTVCDVADDSGFKSEQCAMKSFATIGSPPDDPPFFLGAHSVVENDGSVKMQIFLRDPPLCGRNGELTGVIAHYFNDNPVFHERSCDGTTCLNVIEHAISRDNAKDLTYVSFSSANSFGNSSKSQLFSLNPSQSSSDVDVRVMNDSGRYSLKIWPLDSRIETVCSKYGVMACAWNGVKCVDVQIFNSSQARGDLPGIAPYRNWRWGLILKNCSNQNQTIFSWQRDTCVYAANAAPRGSSSSLSLEIQNVSRTSLALSWKNLPCQDRGGGINDFVIFNRTNMSQPWQNVTYRNDQPWRREFRFVLGDLKPSTLYYVRVVARNEWGALSDELKVSTAAPEVNVAGVAVGAVLVCCFPFCCLFAVRRCKARRRNLAKIEKMYLNDLNDTVVEKNDKVGIDSPVFESRMIFRNVSNSDEVSAGTSGIGTSKSSKDSSSSDSPSTSSSTSHRSHPADKVYEGD